MSQSYHQAKLPLPPYGKILDAFQSSKIPLRETIFIYTGKHAREIAYEVLRDRIPACYLPYGDDFRNFRWPIENQDVIIDDTGLSSIPMLRQMTLFLFNEYHPRQITFHFDEMTIDDLLILKRS